MMAAYEAAQTGANVLLLEKNRRLGEKLRITGGGRCNITNNTPVVRELLSQYKEAGKFLFSPFAVHSVVDTLNWLQNHGIKTSEEAGRRVFPESKSAVKVTETFILLLRDAQVTVHTNAAVVTCRFDCQQQQFLIEVAGGEGYVGKKVIVASGGRSRPETGSTGDGFAWLESFGHTTVSPYTALVPVVVRERSVVARLSGLPLPACGVVTIINGQRTNKVVGKLLFTHVGLSGPVILNLSGSLAPALLDGQEVVLALDFLPAVATGELDRQLVEIIMATPNRLIHNLLVAIIPRALTQPVLALAAIPEDTPAHSLTVAMRKQLGAVLKSFPLSIERLLGPDKAVITAGGVALEEIDFRTMESKLQPGLFVIGDMLNIDRPSGGYSLQLCWTTGYVAGRAAAART